MKYQSYSLVAALVAATLLSPLFFTAGQASAQTMPTVPGMTQVSGKYTNEDAGVEIVFPEGWQGFEIKTAEVLMVMTSPGGMMSENGTTEAIGLIVSDRASVENPNDPSTYTNDSVSGCSTPAIVDVRVSGKAGKEITVECEASNGDPVKMKIAFVLTDTKWIGVMYMAPPADFEADAAKFDSSVSSLKVEGAVDANASGGQVGATIGLDLKAMTQPVTIGGKSISVDLKTNSTISNFALDESNKRLSFKAEGETGTHGTTEVSIGKVLKGPYTVTIDGQSTSNFKVTGDEASADATMMISYTHSSHDVAITGASVVPEFPIAIVGVIAALMGMVVIAGRTKLIRS